MARTAIVQIKQIAERVGLSPSTVSIVLNGRGDEMRISKESQRRVLEAAKEMSYRPAGNARHPRTIAHLFCSFQNPSLRFFRNPHFISRHPRTIAEDQAEKTVGVFWNESFGEDTMNRYFSGLFKASEENHYDVEFVVKMFRNGELSALRDHMNQKRYSGILICGVSSADMEYLNEQEFDVPIVVNRPSNKFSSVCADAYEIGAECARMFAKRGFRTAGILSANAGSIGIGLRELGFLNECRTSGLTVRDEWIVKGKSMDMETGYECAKSFSEMKERPEGLFILLDSLALGAMMQFKGSDIRIPEEMSIVAYGLNPMLRHISPSVTMIGNSMVDTGRNAIDILMTVMNNKISMPISKLIPLKYEFGETFRLAGMEKK